MSSRWSKSSETVSIAEYNILKDKYERLVIENKSLIQTIELLEKTQGRTLERREQIANLANNFGEMQKMLQTFETDIKFIMSVDDDITEMNGGGEASGSARPAKKPKVETKEDVIMLLSDDEEGDQRESNGRQSSSSHQDPFIPM
ncbi:PREDICTED: uncharacterized protein LOC104717915 [Camelina sativa]|uniref:Uncharacterized protein LOC104717915 n=1 Tax=Camelina sativa TaxID=90675 RepID=A0ABM0U013_CAMSA|nr:PREDICTED: uncharacterized protein LOC104717915 [Camelina sativa]XP_019086084.1 PREDICTED: uncharacterized protein LOC104717915 [Camelina sativa]